MTAPDQDNAPAFTRQWANVADATLGAYAVEATDEFFGGKARLLKPEAPISKIGTFDAHGQWMDGWESRRRRVPGHDHVVVRLAARCRIHGFDIDTAFFTGNYAPAASIEACLSDSERIEEGDWRQVMPHTPLGPNAHHYIAVDDPELVSHIRLHIYPDGGVARLRVYGEVAIDWSRHDPDEMIDLAALMNGGRAVAWNDSHYGTPSNILKPGRGTNMADGWETRRRREPGYDWTIIALGSPGAPRRLEIDTTHFKGNNPARCSVQGAISDTDIEQALVAESLHWPDLLPEQPIQPNAAQVFEDELRDLGPISHVRLNMIPDGGISRFRVHGHRGEASEG